MFTNEEYWLLTGHVDRDLWWGKRSQKTEGRPVTVAFDPHYVIKREEDVGDVVGFLHTHPNMTASPSFRDDRTMWSWVCALGKPLVCCILGADGLRAWWYDDDESPPYEACVKKIKNLVFGCTIQKPEDFMDDLKESTILTKDDAKC
jgi:proteasome lid subunit RPN8/RPN11